MSKTVKAVGYGRTSSESGEDKASVDIQRADFEKACKANGWVNAGWFEDRDISGRAYETGSAFIKLDAVTASYLSSKPKAKQARPALAKALASGASVLWVRDVTRFARPLSGSFLAPYLRGKLSELGITLWAGNVGHIDYSKLETSLVQSIQSEIEDSSIKTKTAQSRASRDAIRDAGERVYCKPDCLGFRYAGKHAVTAVAAELATVKRIYRLYLSGKTIRQICIALNQDGIQPYNGGSQWYRRTISQVLSRPWYCGLQYASDNKTLIQSKPFACHAVISVDDWQKAQARLSGNTSKGQRREAKFAHPLAGLVRCGYCGSVMRPISVKSAKWGIQRLYYCSDFDNHGGANIKPECKASAIRETMQDLVAIDATEGYLAPVKTPKPLAMAGLIEALQPLAVQGYIRQLQATDTTPELQATRDGLKQKLQALTDKLTSRYRGYEEGLMPKPVYARLVKESKAEEDQLTKQLTAIEKQIQASQSKPVLTVADFDRLDRMDHRTYTALLASVVSAVYCYSDRIELEFVDKPDQRFSLYRVKIRNGKQLPVPTVHILSESTSPSAKISPDRLQIVYTYPKGQSNGRKEHGLIYSNKATGLQVLTEEA